MLRASIDGGELSIINFEDLHAIRSLQESPHANRQCLDQTAHVVAYIKRRFDVNYSLEELATCRIMALLDDVRGVSANASLVP